MIKLTGPGVLPERRKAGVQEAVAKGLERGSTGYTVHSPTVIVVKRGGPSFISLQLFSPFRRCSIQLALPSTDSAHHGRNGKVDLVFPASRVGAVAQRFTIAFPYISSGDGPLPARYRVDCDTSSRPQTTP